MKEKSYQVTGMTCSACSAAVSRAVGKLDGVHTADVNLATETLRVSYDESKLDFNAIQAAVERAGYGLVEPQVLKRAELGVDGMTCASCSSAVERALKKLDGVEEPSVNLATNRAAFSYDPTKVKLAQVREAITKAGYTPLDLASEDTRDAEQEKREKALRLMRLRLIVAIVFAAPILYIAMAHMFPTLGVPLPAFMNPHTFPLVFALVQLVLTIPVLIAGGGTASGQLVGFAVILQEPRCRSAHAAIVDCHATPFRPGPDCRPLQARAMRNRTLGMTERLYSFPAHTGLLPHPRRAPSSPPHRQRPTG